MRKVSIKPQPMSVERATLLFEALEDTGRQEFYKSLSDDEKDALYTKATDNLIARVDLREKNRIDAKMNKQRNTRRGYIVSDESHRAENQCLWRSAAWYILLGQVSESLRKNLSHMQAHFDALQEAETHHGNHASRVR